MELSLGQIEQATGAQLSGATSLTAGREHALQMSVRGWSIDSRTIERGDLFVALRGERFDGHEYIRAALDRGATAVLAERFAELPGLIFKTPDTLAALQKLARYARKIWQRPLVAVTGSAGKTSTKDVIAALLSTRFQVGKTIGNLNNHIGLPLTLLRMPEQAEMGVVEMGMNHAGEIRELAKIATPQMGLVTNVGYAHIEAFDSIDGVAAAKRELIENLPPDGIAVLNADDGRVVSFREAHRGRTVLYGLSAKADVRATDVELGSQGSSFRVNGTLFETRLQGAHSVSNILAGVAVAQLFDIPLTELRLAISELEPGKMRGDRYVSHGITIWNDAYNSNPEAARSMVDVLRAEPAKRRVAVLGEMLELGRWAEKLHRDLGRYVADSGVDILVGVRGASRWMIDEAEHSGMSPDQAKFFDEPEQAGDFLRTVVRTGDAILFKGSRGTQVERALARMDS